MTARLCRYFASLFGCAMGALLVTGSSLGQPPTPTPMPPVMAPPATDPGLKQYPDPTVPDAALKGMLSKTGTTALPKEVRIRGRVITKDRAAVVLEIEGQTYFLPVGGEARSIRVKAITADGVTIEVGSAKDVKVLH